MKEPLQPNNPRDWVLAGTVESTELHLESSVQMWDFVGPVNYRVGSSVLTPPNGPVSYHLSVTAWRLVRYGLYHVARPVRVNRKTGNMVVNAFLGRSDHNDIAEMDEASMRFGWTARHFFKTPGVPVQ